MDGSIKALGHSDNLSNAYLDIHWLFPYIIYGLLPVPLLQHQKARSVMMDDNIDRCFTLR